MKRPQILTKLHLFDEKVSSIDLKVSDLEPSGNGYVFLNVKLTPDLDRDCDYVKAGDEFRCDCVADLKAYSGDVASRSDSDTIVAKASIESRYTFKATEDILVADIDEHNWVLELTLRPLLLSRLRNILRHTPIESVPLNVLKDTSDD